MLFNGQVEQLDRLSIPAVSLHNLLTVIFIPALISNIAKGFLAESVGHTSDVVAYHPLESIAVNSSEIPLWQQGWIA